MGLTVSLFHDIQRGMIMAVRVRANAGSKGPSAGGTFVTVHRSMEVGDVQTAKAKRPPP